MVSGWRSLQPRCTRSWPTGRRSRSARPSPADFDAVKAMHEAMSPDNATCGSSTSAVSRPRSRPGGSPATRSRAARRCWRVADGRGGRRGQLRAAPRRPAHGRGRVRRGRPHAPQGHRHPAARAPGLAGPEPPDQHVHGRDPDREPGHAPRLRRRRPAGPAPLPRGRHRADVPAARPGRPGSGHLPGRRGRAGAPRGRGQPAAHLRARVGRGDRRQPRRGTVGRAILDNIRAGGYRGRLLGREPARAGRSPASRAWPRARPARARRPGGDRRARRPAYSRWPRSAASAASAAWS